MTATLLPPLLLLLLQALAPGMSQSGKVTYQQPKDPIVPTPKIGAECNCQDCKTLPFGDFTLVSKNSPLCDAPSCLYQQTGANTQMCFCDAKIGMDWKKEEYKACDQDVLPSDFSLITTAACNMEVLKRFGIGLDNPLAREATLGCRLCWSNTGNLGTTRGLSNAQECIQGHLTTAFSKARSARKGKLSCSQMTTWASMWSCVADFVKDNSGSAGMTAAVKYMSDSRDLEFVMTTSCATTYGNMEGEDEGMFEECNECWRELVDDLKWNIDTDGTIDWTTTSDETRAEMFKICATKYLPSQSAVCATDLARVDGDFALIGNNDKDEASVLRCFFDEVIKKDKNGSVQAQVRKEMKADKWSITIGSACSLEADKFDKLEIRECTDCWERVDERRGSKLELAMACVKSQMPKTLPFCKNNFSSMKSIFSCINDYVKQNDPDSKVQKAVQLYIEESGDADLVIGMSCAITHFSAGNFNIRKIEECQQCFHDSFRNTNSLWSKSCARTFLPAINRVCNSELVMFTVRDEKSHARVRRCFYDYVLKNDKEAMAQKWEELGHEKGMFGRKAKNATATVQYMKDSGDLEFVMATSCAVTYANAEDMDEGMFGECNECWRELINDLKWNEDIDRVDNWKTTSNKTRAEMFNICTSKHLPAQSSVCSSELSKLDGDFVLFDTDDEDEAAVLRCFFDYAIKKDTSGQTQAEVRQKITSKRAAIITRSACNLEADNFDKLEVRECTDCWQRVDEMGLEMASACVRSHFPRALPYCEDNFGTMESIYSCVKDFVQQNDPTGAVQKKAQIYNEESPDADLVEGMSCAISQFSDGTFDIGRTTACQKCFQDAHALEGEMELSEAKQCARLYIPLFYQNCMSEIVMMTPGNEEQHIKVLRCFYDYALENDKDEKAQKWEELGHEMGMFGRLVVGPPKK